MKSDAEESSLKWCEWWLGNGWKGIFLVIESGGGLRDRMGRYRSTLEFKIDGLSILKKDLEIFEAHSNVEEVTWVSFILESADLLLEAKD